MTAEMAKGCEMKVKNTREEISIELILKKKDQKVDIRQVFKDILAKPKLSDLQIRFTKDGYTLNKNEENGLLNSVPEIMDIFLNIYGNAYQSSVSHGNKEDRTAEVKNVVNQQEGQSINGTPRVSTDEQKKTSLMQKDNKHAVETTHFGQNEFDNKCKSNDDKEKGINTTHSITDSVPRNSDEIRTSDIDLDMSSMESKHSYGSQECHGKAQSKSRNLKSAGESGSHEETSGIHHRNNTVMNEAKTEQDNANKKCGKRPEHYTESATGGARMTQDDISDNPQDSSKENHGKMPKDDVKSSKADASEDKQDNSKENHGKMPKDDVKSSKDDASEDKQDNSKENHGKMPKDDVESGKNDACEDTQDNSKENHGKIPKDDVESGKNDASEDTQDNSKEKHGKIPKHNVKSSKDGARVDTQGNSDENHGKMPKADAESGKDDPKKTQVIPKNSGEKSRSMIYPSSGESRETEDITKENRGEVPQKETRLTTDCDMMKLDHSKGPSAGSRQHRKH